MATLNRITVVDSPFQELELVLQGAACSLVLTYNKIINRWSLDLGMNASPVVISGRRIVLGVDLIEVYKLGIGKIYAVDYYQMGVDPGYDELVDGRVRLYHLSDDEYEAILALSDEPAPRTYIPSVGEE